MEVKPILFSPPMVEALLSRRKHHTRRLIRGVDACDDYRGRMTLEMMKLRGFSDPRGYAEFTIGDDPLKRKYIRIPSQKGDILYVRETWQPCYIPTKHPNPDGELEGVRYGADGSVRIWSHEKDYQDEDLGRWHPNIHMPRSASRIWLEVMDCYPERIQSITDEHCVEEECYYDAGTGLFRASEIASGDTAKDAFRCLWYDINGVESWMANPWVWVRVFKVLSISGKPSTVTI